MKYIPALLLFAVSSTAYSQNKPGILTDTTTVAIIHRDSLSPIQLSNDDIAIAEKVFVQVLEKEFGRFITKKTKSQYGIDIKRYRIQLQPRSNAKGELEMVVNCFCDPGFRFEWRKKWFSRHGVEDGGSCFFDFVINIKEQRYYDFGMNGVG